LEVHPLVLQTLTDPTDLPEPDKTRDCLTHRTAVEELVASGGGTSAIISAVTTIWSRAAAATSRRTSPDIARLAAANSQGWVSCGLAARIAVADHCPP
jgi:hypothetical protein